MSAAVVPLAAAVAVWSPLGNAFPAEATRAPQAEVARPATLRTTAGQCVWELQRADPYSVLAGGEGSLATSALYRFADGETHFCVAFAAGSVDNRVEVDSLGRQVLWGWVKNQDGSFDASLFGPRKAGYARVVVSTPDGQQYQTIFLDRYWWTPVHVADQSLLDDSRWTAYDRYGRLVGQGRVSTDY
ncbi:hypothetical protein [Kineococcus sp. R86509]|uniref:hypothetical protein n=1 Tax=Kineococcus sp. R86509 TaxID=3093851 RepID=UPI0036D309D0